MDNLEPAAMCTLTQPELKKRQADIRTFLTPHLLTASYASGVSRLTFAKPEVSCDQLDALVALEQVCCPAFRFDIRDMDTTIMLTVSGPETSTDFIQDLFSPDEPKLRSALD